MIIRIFFGLVWLVLVSGCASLPKLVPEQRPSQAFLTVLDAEPAPLTTWELEINMVSVGQGDGLVLRTGTGEVMVVDTGTRKGGRALVKFMRGRGITAVDLLVLTHPHADHIGGARSLFDAFQVKEVWQSGMAATSKTYLKTLERIHGAKVTQKVVRRGLDHKMNAKTKVHVFAPEEPLVFGSRSDANANSVVLWVAHGEVDLLLTGDSEEETEQRLLRALQGRAPTEFEILKVAHHGSRYSSSSTFLRRIQPVVALISCGIRNRYGHPHPETLDRLKAVGAKVFRTDLNGTITIRSDGVRIRIYLDRASSGQKVSWFMIWPMQLAQSSGQMRYVVGG